MTSRSVRVCAAMAGAMAAGLVGPALTRAQDAGSPAEQRIAWAQKAIAADKTQAQPYNELGWGFARRARETGDPAYYDRAAEAARSALALDPANLETTKLQVWILLGKHDFAQARDAARALNQQVPDDVLVYGFLADANVELGNYDEAESAVQWMLDMRPANLSGLTRTAYLRELFGDPEGALDMFGMALNRMAPSEVEDRAWILSQVGQLQLSTGKETDAEAALQQALEIFPVYHYALAYLSNVRLAQKRNTEAVALLRQLCAALPHAENLYALAEALESTASPEAKQVFDEFEAKALKESSSLDNANRELTFYYSDHAGRARDALRIAELERSRRHDVYTLDAYAWALTRNGRHAEARREIESALGVGIRNARMFYHAGVIALAQGDRDAAAKYLTRSLEQEPHSRVAPAARVELTRLTPAAQGR